MTKKLTREERRERLQQVIGNLSEDLTEWVTEVENSVAVTQNHYGRYLDIITMVAKGNKSLAIITGEALKTAGANVCGVNDALRIYMG